MCHSNFLRGRKKKRPFVDTQNGGRNEGSERRGHEKQYKTKVIISETKKSVGSNDRTKLFAPLGRGGHCKKEKGKNVEMASVIVRKK